MDTGEQAEEESSANRRERLLALRSAAAASSSSSPSAAPPLPSAAAAWDLPEPDLTPSSAPRPPARFGFYTNPGAAFSSAAAPHKRKSPDLGSSPAPAPPHAGFGNYGNNYPPPHQHHMDPSSMEPPPPGTSPWRAPMQFQTPMSEYRGAPPGPPPHWNPHSASPAQDSYPCSPNFGFRGSNVGRGGNPMNYGPRGSPMNYGPRDSPMNYGPSDSPMNYGPRGSPMNYGPRGSPMNYGPRGSPMNYGPRGSPCSSSGRGRGENYYSSPGSRGRGGRGGSGFRNHYGGKEKDYLQKSMADDPWKNLRPIVGSILIPIGGGARSWLPESLRTKKDNIPAKGPAIPTSGLSLAEYLDLSFNEVSNDT
uniref:Uncharacterized protein n=1 Tax=Avena sativa TaxID=4498 RepID=A0ACD5U1B3_AVESA